MDDRSIGDTARYFLWPGEMVSWKPPDPQRAGCAPLAKPNLYSRKGQF